MPAALTPEQEWTLVACGLIAHADDVVEFGEWEHILRLVDASVEDEGLQPWLDLLGDRGALESRFRELAPPLPFFADELLERTWQMALADGSASEVEAEVHDRIAERVGVSPERARELRAQWTREAGDRAELVIAFAAGLANLDGRLDSAEASQFDSLLERMPLAVARRLELAELLYAPPDLAELGQRLAGLPEVAREGVLREIAGLVEASADGSRERRVFLELAERAAIPRDKAQRMLES